MSTTVELFLLALLSLSSDAFRIVSITPSQGLTTSVGLNGTFVLRCRVDSDMRSCLWKHKQKTCRLEYSKTAKRLVKSRCRVYESQVFSVGDYRQDECAIRVHGATPYEDGLWTCEIREYITRLFFWLTPKTARASFRVNVLEDPEPEPSLAAEEVVNRIWKEREKTEPVFVSSEDEENIALYVLGSILGIVILAVLVAVILGLLWKKGVFGRRTHTEHSVRLRELEQESDSADNEGRESRLLKSKTLERSNDKAREKLGVFKYDRSRRVL